MPFRKGLWAFALAIGSLPFATLADANADPDPAPAPSVDWILELANGGLAPVRDESTGAVLGATDDLERLAGPHPAARARLRSVVPLTRHLGAAIAVEALATDPLRPAASGRPAPVIGHGAFASASLPEAALVLQAGPMRLSAGRQPIVWGPGAFGTLLLSPTAPPLDALRVELARPWHGWSFDLFAARMEDARGHPLASGQRLAWAPGPWMTLFAQRALLCCEAGSGVRAGDVPAILLATHENEAGHRLDFDQLASLGAAVALPRAWADALPGPLAGTALALHYEWGGTDLYGVDDLRRRGGLPRLIAPGWVVGGSLGLGPLRLRAENATLHVRRTNFYAGRRDPQGWTHLGQPLGHPSGGRTLSTVAEAMWTFPDGTELGAFWRSDRMNADTPDDRTRTRGGLRVGWQPRPAWRELPRIEASVEHLADGDSGDRGVRFRLSFGGAARLTSPGGGP